MAEIMFEMFEFPTFYLANQAVLSLYSSSRTTGLVLDSGEDTTYTVPIYEGSALLGTIERIDLGGRDLTTHLAKLLKIEFFSSDLEHAREIKEEQCYVALNFE